MATYKLKWEKVEGAIGYDIYVCTVPGGAYNKIGHVEAVDSPEFEYQVDMVPENLTVTPTQTGLLLTWDPPSMVGAPVTFKIVPL